ncbi:hypothetical protein CFP65_3266 [Kitasatospora sp. MMS16-BH015]|uniref:hypothetical protein n=1 Tax=Kitasatospora sp. MMS16-BH015 TaxID=2018025 RepID=UPI000CA0E782|nr:hypothetical protein [Kitasatospora sp. MMS16-BH015]AUG78067.1 hypothetical protein CFP65_3266 [Kitasatospora sp. MMS16-BH015]
MPRPAPSETGSAPRAGGRLRASVLEAVGGLPSSFWWLFVSTLVNRIGGFVLTFVTLA